MLIIRFYFARVAGSRFGYNSLCRSRIRSEILLMFRVTVVYGEYL